MNQRTVRERRVFLATFWTQFDIKIGRQEAETHLVPHNWSLWANGPQPIWSTRTNGPYNIPFVQKDRLWGNTGTKLVGDHLSRKTKFFGTICPWGPNLMGTVCPGGSNWLGTICTGGPNFLGPFVHGDRKWGDRKSGDQMGSGPNESQLIL